MKKSMLGVLFLSSMLALTGCNQDIKAVQSKLESDYKVQLDIEKQDGKYVITSSDFYLLSEPKQYDMLLDVYSYYKGYSEKDVTFGILSNEDLYTLDYNSQLPTLNKNGTVIYSRSLSRIPKSNPYNEEQMISIVKERIGNTLEYTKLLVIGDNVSGNAAGQNFIAVFDSKGTVTITIIS